MEKMFEQLTEELAAGYTKVTLLDALGMIIAALIILLIGWIAGRLIGKAVGLLVDKLGVDKALEKVDTGDWMQKSGWSISKSFDVVVRWFIYIIAIMAAVDVLQIEFLSSIMQMIALFFPRLIAAAIVLIVGLLLIAFAMRWIEEALETNEIPLATMLAPVLEAIMVIIVMVLAMDQLLIDTTIIYTFIIPLAWGLAIGIGVAIGIAVGWGGRDSVAEYMQERLKEGKKENK
ncbi:Conserved TM helix domain containing protein [Candidatus Methanophagaceae archaeon]|nr:Conserved TM helix domain containing protein [Methanophagales archaeon]